MGNILTFDRIKQGLEKIKNVGIIEEDVKVHGVLFRLRTLRTKDHRQVNTYVSSYMEQYQGEESAYPLDATMDFFTVRKIEPLSHAILRVGDIDFEGVAFVETGERDRDGNAIKKEKHVFVRELLREMDISVVDTLHRKYTDMLVKAEELAAKEVSFRDLEEELVQLENRRSEIYKELGRDMPSANAAPETAAEVTGGFAQAEPRGKEVEEPAPREREEQKPEEIEESSSYEDGYHFVPLEDPERELSVGERAFMAEQERLYQQRYKDGEPSKESEEAAALLQKKRRQPLNRVDPVIQEGSRPKGFNPEPAGSANPNYNPR